MSMNMHNSPHLDTTACEVCAGTGKVYEEHPDGSLSEHTCPYCHGAKNSTWVRDKFDAMHQRWFVIKALICVYWAAWWLVIRVDTVFPYSLIAFLVGVPMGLWWFTHPAPNKRRRIRRPNPLTTDKERLLGGAVIGGALLKSKWDQHERREQQLRQLAQRQQQPPPNPPQA